MYIASAALLVSVRGVEVSGCVCFLLLCVAYVLILSAHIICSLFLHIFTSFNNKSSDIRGRQLEPWEKPSSSLAAGNYTACTRRGVRLLAAESQQRIIGDPPGNPRNKNEFPAQLEVSYAGEEGDGLYTAVLTFPFTCANVNLTDDGQQRNCPDNPEEGRTLIREYYAATQSFVQKKKKEISFISHYAEFLNAQGDYEDLEDTLEDAEVSFLDILVQGKYVYGDLRNFYSLPFRPRGRREAAITAAFVFANDEDGCPETEE